MIIQYIFSNFCVRVVSDSPFHTQEFGVIFFQIRYKSLLTFSQKRRKSNEWCGINVEYSNAFDGGLQIVHCSLQDDTRECPSKCFFLAEDVWNAWSQTTQTYGRSPVCTRICSFSWPARRNFLSHSVHPNGFSPVWIRRCTFKLLE